MECYADPLVRQTRLSLNAGMKLGVLIIIGFAFSGCVFIDNREKVAMTTMYPDEAPVVEVKSIVRTWQGCDFWEPNCSPTVAVSNYSPVRPAPTLTGALNGKFPVGTEIDRLKSYIETFKGSCSQAELGKPVNCSFIESATICFETKIFITAKTNSQNKIESISASRYSSGC
jgi:hypothetical protein